MWCLFLGMRWIGQMLMTSSQSVSKSAEAGLFGAYLRAGGPHCCWQSCLFWEEACYGFVAGVLEAGLLVAVVPAGYIGSVKLMRSMRCLFHSLSTPWVHADSVGCVNRGIGVLCVVMACVVTWIPGLGGSSQTCMASTNGSLMPWCFFIISQGKWS